MQLRQLQLKLTNVEREIFFDQAGPGVILDSQMPHLIGIDDDLHSTGITLYHLKVSIN